MNVAQVIAEVLKRKGVEILHALVRGIRKTQEGTPVLLEFITAREKTFSTG